MIDHEKIQISIDIPQPNIVTFGEIGQGKCFRVPEDEELMFKIEDRRCTNAISLVTGYGYNFNMNTPVVRINASVECNDI